MIEAPSDDLVREVGMRLHAELPATGRSPRRLVEERLMGRLAGEPHTKAALFRFVDVAPMCRNRRDLANHLSALIGEVQRPPGPIGLAASLGEAPALAAAVGGLAERAVRAMAGRFIVGRDIEAAASELGRLWKQGAANTVDLLGEATVTESEANRYAGRCAETLERLAEISSGWSDQNRRPGDRHGALPRANLSLKVSALTPHARPEAPGRGADSARRRLRDIFGRGRDLGAHVHVDMESLDLRETTTKLVRELLAEREFADGPSAGIVIQAYLRDSGDELERWLEWVEASRRNVPLTIRLVKGAYWDHEVAEAASAGWKSPVYEQRAECDRNFERLSRRLVSVPELVRPAIASHNLRSVAHAIAASAQTGAEDVLELQVLRGLGDDLQVALSRLGYRVRTYCPIGDLVAGMAYLVRRLLENTSNDSFLRIRATADDPVPLLLAP